MALPYPVDQMAAMQIPDPDNPYPPPSAYHAGYPGYPLVQPGYPMPAPGYQPQQPGQFQQLNFPEVAYPPPANPGYPVAQPIYPPPPPQPGFPQDHTGFPSNAVPGYPPAY